MTAHTSNSATNTPGSSLANLARLLADRKLPPVEQWNPAFCGDIDMRIARDGTWFYLGTPIVRPPMVKLFASVLRKEADGSYVLVTPAEKVGITVEDAPFIAVEAFSEGDGKARRFGFRLNTDDAVMVDADHRLRVKFDPVSQEPRPYVHVRRGMEALINRSVFYEIVAWAMADQKDNQTLGLWSNGVWFPIDGSGA
jgi:uncharacterized protein